MRISAEHYTSRRRSIDTGAHHNPLRAQLALNTASPAP